MVPFIGTNYVKRKPLTFILLVRLNILNMDVVDTLEYYSLNWTPYRLYKKFIVHGIVEGFENSEKSLDKWGDNLNEIKKKQKHNH